MKKLLFLLISILTFIACNKDENSKASLNLKIQIVIREEIYNKNGELLDNSVMEEQYFNEKGLIVRKETSYFQDVFIGRKYIFFSYKYDDKNRLIEIKETDSKIEFDYNDIDSVSEKRIYNSASAFNCYKYIYNEKRQLIEVILTNTRDETFPFYKLSYLGNLLIHKDRLNNCGNITQTFDYEYDSHNNLLKITKDYVESLAPMIETTEYTYNENGTIKTRKTDFEKESYTYNPDKTIKEIKVQSTGYRIDLEIRRTYEYYNEWNAAVDY